MRIDNIPKIVLVITITKIMIRLKPITCGTATQKIIKHVCCTNDLKIESLSTKIIETTFLPGMNKRSYFSTNDLNSKRFSFC